MGDSTLVCCAEGANPAEIPAKRLSPGAAALRYHGLICRQCRDTARGGHPIWFLCGAGYILAIATLRARGRRMAS